MKFLSMHGNQPKHFLLQFIHMKKVFHFFGRSDEETSDIGTAYRPREPVLTPIPRSISPKAPTGTRPGSSSPRAESEQAPRSEPHIQAQDFTRESGKHRQENERHAIPPDAGNTLPTGYADLMQYFEHIVSERKSPYNALVKAADRLKEFIPNETSRLQAALAICGDQWPAEALSLAINAHVSDIELARKKALSHAHVHAAEYALALRAQAQEIEQDNARLAKEIQSLSESLGQLQTKLHANRTRLDDLHGQIRLAETSGSANGFVDQAAENLKNDLLAKKAILGLP